MIDLLKVFGTWGLAIFFDSLMDSINFRSYAGYLNGGTAWHVVKILMQICFCLSVIFAYKALYIFNNDIQMVMVIGGVLIIETAMLQYLFYHLILNK